jgi:ABC-type antimicrobial peptide transport system permease subunit
LYGVLAYSVAQRTREFGVRIALGASPKDLLTLVFRDALTMTLAGTAAGAIMSFWTAKLLDAFLYDVAPTDVTALVGAEALLMTVSLLACTAPALRAARATPVEILRAV